MWLKEKSFDGLIQKWWKEMSMRGWMGFQLDQKFKLLKKQLNVWKKDTCGKVEDQMVNLLHDMKLLYVKRMKV